MEIRLKASEYEIVRRILQANLPDIPCWVFGSRITERVHPYSDLDLALITVEPIALEQLAYLKEQFVESDLPFKVDLVDWCRIDLEFQGHIESGYVELSWLG